MPFLERGSKLVDGKYVIEELLGHGAMGAVYLALNTENNDKVAVKLLLKDDESADSRKESERRFRDEGLALSRLSHPSLVKFIERGEDKEDGLYIVLEYVAGEDLRTRIENGEKMTWQEAFEKVGEPVLSALSTMHRAGIIHRDVKPGNIIARSDGPVVLADLGLAAFDEREAKTQTGMVVGTPGYLPPERLLEANVAPSPKGDVYAAALVLVELTTGRLPFAGTNPSEWMHNQLRKNVTPAMLMSLGLPPTVAATLSRALQIRPDDRPTDAGALLAELQEIPASDTVTIKPPKPVTVSKPKATSSPLRWISPVLLLLVIIFLVQKANRTGVRKQDEVELVIASIAETIDKRDVEECRKLYSSLNKKLGNLKRKGVTEGALLKKYLKPINGYNVFYNALKAHCLLFRSKWSKALEIFSDALSRHRQASNERDFGQKDIAIDLLLLEGYSKAIIHQSRGKLIANSQYEEVFADGVLWAARSSNADFHSYLVQLYLLRAKNLVEAALRKRMTSESDTTTLIAAFEDMQPALKVLVCHPNLTTVEAQRLANWLAWTEEPTLGSFNVVPKGRSANDYASMSNTLVQNETQRHNQGNSRITEFNRKMRSKHVLPTGRYPKNTLLSFMSHVRRWHWASMAELFSPKANYISESRAAMSCCDLLHKLYSGNPLDMNKEKLGWGPGLNRKELWLHINRQLSNLAKRAWRKDYIEFFAIEHAMLLNVHRYLAILDRTGLKKNELKIDNWSEAKLIPSYQLYATGLDMNKGKSKEALIKVKLAAVSLEGLLRKIDDLPNKPQEVFNVINIGFDYIFQMVADKKMLPHFDETMDRLLSLIEQKKKKRKIAKLLHKLDLLTVLYRLDSIQCKSRSEEGKLKIELRQRLKAIRSEPIFDKRYSGVRRRVDLVLGGYPSITP